MRKLVTIRRISALLPIEGADLIVTAVIDGWTVVVKKDQFSADDHCVYFEIDSFLPDGNPVWQHLVDKQSRIFEGKKGHRLRTVKLRGQLSQGLALPLSSFPDVIQSRPETGELILVLPSGDLEYETFVGVGDVDLSEALGVVKYEQPIPAELAGQVSGNFPTFLKKTDQERCQNLIDEIFVQNENSRYEITVKLDGTSFTAFWVDGEEGVCSRNWELKINDSNASNTFVRMLVDSGLQDVLRKYGKNIAVQGELMGPGIQGNREGLKSSKLFVFDIYDIDNGCYFPPHQRHEIFNHLLDIGLNKDMIEHVPVLAMAESLEDMKAFGIDTLLKLAEGSSINNPVREGIVFKRIDGGFSFKSISNRFLLKSED